MATYKPQAPAVENPIPGDGETSINIYGYVPSLRVGVVTVALFGVFGLCHLLYIIVYRKKSMAARINTFEILVVIGCAFEIVGYSFRIISHANPFLLNAFIVQYFMIVVAPVFFSAALYYSFSLFVGQKNGERALLLPISGRTLFITFAVADTLTITTQIAGAALVGVSQSALSDSRVPPLTPKQANNILIAGLVVQVFFFSIFLGLLLSFIIRYIPTLLRAIHGHHVHSNKGFSISKREARKDVAFVSILTTSSILIYIRTLFRLSEAAPGPLSAAMQNEDLFAGLETAPVIAAIGLWTTPLAFLI